MKTIPVHLRQTSEYDLVKMNIKRKFKSNSRDKFIIFPGCDTESKASY